MDVPGLADAVAAVLCLGVHGGVPVAVVEDDGVGPGQIHPHTSAAGRQNKAEDAPICVEALHEGLWRQETEDEHQKHDSRAPHPGRD